MRYTIQTATPSGKVDQTYGPEYLVTFNEDDREVKMNRKFPPKTGSELIGDIITASWGSYFKKDPNGQLIQKPASDMPPGYIPKKNEHTMYVSYAKDLLIAYMNKLEWDFGKVSEEGFDMTVRLVAAAAKIMESEE